MKKELTIDESHVFTAWGVDPGCASTSKVTYDDNLLPTTHPVFTLSDILSLLPVEIDGNCISMMVLPDEDGDALWRVCYIDIEDGTVFLPKEGMFFDEELIDALHELLFWIITNEVTPVKSVNQEIVKSRLQKLGIYNDSDK